MVELSAITTLKMGADVPEWLMALEPHPNVPRSARGNFRFAVDVDVIDLPEFYIVLPRVMGAFTAMIDTSGTEGCIIQAATKPVQLVMAWNTVDSMANGSHAWVAGNESPGFSPHPIGRMNPPAQLAAAPMYEPIQVPDPHPTFWRRMLYAFRGR